MCRKAKCAYLKENGFCLMHKEMCGLKHPDARCRDGVSKARTSCRDDLWRFEASYDYATGKGRLAFRSRNYRRAEVYSQCLKKKRYATEGDASHMARLRCRAGKEQLRVYYCIFCEGYHLTKKGCKTLQLDNKGTAAA